METFGQVVKRERAARGWSQQRLANEAGLNRSHVGQIERQDGGIAFPQYETILAISRAFGLIPRQLIEPTGRTIMEASGQYKTDDTEVDELVQLFNRLPDDDRDRLIAIARAFYQLRKD
ncbi:MAG: helix-turn-helix transcriptional regulator [Gemmatimonadaceae bacterium]|nr:helix-turn-helix transcriptional regulator [Gemmatimonadaceae bacterium]